MPFVIADNVQETSTSTGTGAFTLAGAVPGFVPFSARLAVADTTWYLIEEVDAQGNRSGAWETGIGTYSAANTLTRTLVLESSNANASVTFAAGPKRVAITLPSKGLIPLTLPVQSAEPAALPGAVRLYTRDIAGQTVLKQIRSSGVDSPIQDGIAFNRFIQYRGSAANVVAVGAAAMVASVAVTAVTPASGSAKSQVQRAQQSTVATANSIASLYVNAAASAPVFRGGLAGEGGFRFVHRFALSTVLAGQRFWTGVRDITAAPTNIDPFTSAAPGQIGLASNLATSANWSIVHNVTGTAPTRIDLGANFPVNTADLIELVLFCAPNAGGTAQPVGYRVRRYTTNPSAPAFEATGTLSANLPAGTTGLFAAAWIVNVAAAIASWDFNQLTIESDW